MLNALHPFILLDMTHNALFFATLKRRAEGVLWREVVFFDKNFQFLLKTTIPSEEVLPARLLSVAKNSAL